MSKTTLQIPIEVSLKNEATQVAKDWGYSSLQELVRVFIAQLKDGVIVPRFAITQPQPTAEAIARYEKMVRDVDEGRESVYEASSVDELMDQLHNKKDPILQEVS